MSDFWEKDMRDTVLAFRDSADKEVNEDSYMSNL